MNILTVACAFDLSGVVALCDHCGRQRQAASVFGGPELERVAAASIVSGCCHDCGAGFCLCRGQLACERCPRKNAPVIVQTLSLYWLAVPPAPPTLPQPKGMKP